MLQKLKRFAPKAIHFVAAVSGGSDSVALVRLLAKSEYELELAHFDHGLRPDSAKDVGFVRSLAEQLSLPFHSERADVRRIASAKGWNLEDAARRLRYRFLTRTAKRLGADAILTGHTQDDQAETVLMQVLRGAAFLKGMPARQGSVIRPLLDISRNDLLAYLKAIDQPFCSDPTNMDMSRTRAWLRHDVFPLLMQRYPDVKQKLARLAEIQNDLAEHFAALAEGLLGDEAVAVAKLRVQDPAVQRQVIAALLWRNHIPPDFVHIKQIREALSQDTPQRISLPKDYLARLAYGKLELIKPHPQSIDTETAHDVPVNVDADKAKAFPNLCYRSRRPGDRITLAGGSKKLSDVLIDRKVPREDRNSLRLLASDSEVLWIEDLAVDVRVGRKQPSNVDVRWMTLALEQAQQAADRGEVPVGAVVVRGDALIGTGQNRTEADRDPSAHAEMNALRQAAQHLQDWRLTDCTLYVTLEPCPMCFGAMLQAHLPRLVYGATNEREGALGGVSDLRDAPWKRQLEVKKGVLEREAAQLLSEFFKSRRSKV